MKETVLPMRYRPLICPVEFTSPLVGVGSTHVSVILTLFIKYFKQGLLYISLENWNPKCLLYKVPHYIASYFLFCTSLPTDIFLAESILFILTLSQYGLKFLIPCSKVQGFQSILGKRAQDLKCLWGLIEHSSFRSKFHITMATTLTIHSRAIMVLSWFKPKCLGLIPSRTIWRTYSG